MNLLKSDVFLLLCNDELNYLMIDCVLYIEDSNFMYRTSILVE